MCTHENYENSSKFYFWVCYYIVMHHYAGRIELFFTEVFASYYTVKCVIICYVRDHSRLCKIMQVVHATICKIVGIHAWYKKDVFMSELLWIYKNLQSHAKWSWKFFNNMQNHRNFMKYVIKYICIFFMSFYATCMSIMQ